MKDHNYSVFASIISRRELIQIKFENTKKLIGRKLKTQILKSWQFYETTTVTMNAYNNSLEWLLNNCYKYAINSIWNINGNQANMEI